MAISQDTILNLSRRIKQLLQDNYFKGTPESIKRIKEAKKERVEENRSRPWKIKKLRKQLESGELKKKDVKELLAQMNLLEKDYKPPEDLQNIINKQEGKDFYFNVRLSGFATEVRGKKKSIIKVSAKDFERKSIWEVERDILLSWAKALEEGIESAVSDDQMRALEGLLLSVEGHIQVIDGELSMDELDEYLRAKDLYPIYVFIDPARATIEIFAAVKSTKKKKKK